MVFMKKSTTRLYNWAIHKASSSKAPLWLGILFLCELFLIIPLDAVMMFFCLQKKNNIFLYILIATVSSTVSGLIGYLFGHFLWDLVGNWIVPNLISTASFAKFSAHLDLYDNWAVFFGGLLPFPLKLLSLASGVFHMGVLPFTLCLASARLIRFALIGSAMALWGAKVKLFVDKHFHRLFMLVGAKVAIVIVFFWAMAK